MKALLKSLVPSVAMSLTLISGIAQAKIWTPAPRPPGSPSPVTRSFPLSVRINELLEESQNLSIGSKIVHFENKSSTLLRSGSEDLFDEIPLLTILRTREVATTVLSHAGNNPEMVAQWMANLYNKSFLLALSQANNPAALLRYNTNTREFANYVKVLSSAEYGYYYATLLLRSSTGLVSDSAKGVILLTMLKYMNEDVENDPRRREIGMQQILQKIGELQTSNTFYKNVEQSLVRGEEPNQRDLNALRGQVHNVWSKFPAALKQTGLNPTTYEK